MSKYVQTPEESAREVEKHLTKVMKHMMSEGEQSPVVNFEAVSHFVKSMQRPSESECSSVPAQQQEWALRLLKQEEEVEVRKADGGQKKGEWKKNPKAKETNCFVNRPLALFAH